MATPPMWDPMSVPPEYLAEQEKVRQGMKAIDPVSGLQYDFDPATGRWTQARTSIGMANMPTVDLTTGRVSGGTQPQRQITAPSALAAQESGAIGAASIASQMGGGTQPQGTFVKAAQPKRYTVRRGDTLSEIAKRNNMTLRQLMRFNPKFKNQAKYQGGNMIWRGTKVNLGPKKPGQMSSGFLNAAGGNRGGGGGGPQMGVM